MSTPAATISALYQPLSKEKREIRLVTIISKPSSTRKIECKLEAFALRDAPSYETLSYVWGGIDETVPVTLNGSEIQVTTNLFAALQRLCQRAYGNLTYFWIDALCINQSSTAEKNQQVPLMRNIYQQAKLVVMWLGREENDSSLAIAMIEEWAQGCRLGLELYTKFDSKFQEKIALGLIEDPFNEPSWTAARFLFNRPYWQRIWIVQEVVLSRVGVMICGDAEVSFDHLWFAIGAWSQLSSPEGLALITVDQQWTIISSIPQRVNHLMVMFREQMLKGQTEPSKLHPLHNLLRRTCSCLASNPRDKVYGVLGLIEEDEADLAPDYNRSVVQVFTDVVVMHTRATMKLSIIGFRTNTFSHGIRTPGLPSWVPDLSSTQDAARPFVNWNFHSAEATAAQYQFSDDFKVLTARGIIADEIDAIEPNRDFAQHSEILNCWLKFAAVCSRQLHPTGIPWRQAFFRAIVGDESGYAYGRSGFRNNEHRKVFYEHAVAFILLIGKELFGKSKVRNNGERETDGEEGMKSIEHMFRDQGLDSLAKPFFLLSTEVPDTKSQVYTATLLKEFLGQPGMKGHMDSSLINIPEINKPKSKGASFLVLFREVIVQRNFFFTKRGYMGLAPIGAKEGDRVCVLHGLESPLLVRPQDDYYLVVGGSYIYGMMNGEVMQDVRDGKLQCEDLNFR